MIKIAYSPKLKHNPTILSTMKIITKLILKEVFELKKN